GKEGQFGRTDPLPLAPPNLYAYAVSNPVSFIDPLGLDDDHPEDIRELGSGLRAREELLTTDRITDPHAAENEQRARQQVQTGLNGAKDVAKEAGKSLSPSGWWPTWL